MHHKNILLLAKTTRYVERMRELRHPLDVSILHMAPDAFTQAISSGRKFDLIILDTDGLGQEVFNSLDDFISDNGYIPTLVIQDESMLSSLRLPVQGRSDFILDSAGQAELAVRCSLLLRPGDQSAPSDIIAVDNMKINLATYQVYIDDEPVDLTLMEYSLLSFLATHPSRAYSRETLLHRVWGFEYCGGTRTVDVHIRRVRSKIGPLIAAHIVTVRGVGYLFRI